MCYCGRNAPYVCCPDSRLRADIIQVPERLLMGPGPSNAHPAVLAAQSLPLLGALRMLCIPPTAPHPHAAQQSS